MTSSEHLEEDTQVLDVVSREQCPRWIATTNVAFRMGINKALQGIDGMVKSGELNTLESMWSVFKSTMDVLLPTVTLTCNNKL
jgi:hypothetical protein